MNTKIQNQINNILGSGFNVPHIFQEILKHDKLDFFDKDTLKQIIYLERSYSEDHRKKDVFEPATLLLVTTLGLIYVTEGKDDIDFRYGGYKLQFIPFHSINYVTLDSIMLAGKFTILVNNKEITLEFNRAHYFEDFIDLTLFVKNKIVES